MSREFRVDVRRCEDTRVFLANSPDIHGLVIEAGTIGRVTDVIEEHAPRLIETNLGVKPDEGYVINVRYIPSNSPTVQRLINVEIPLEAQSDQARQGIGAKLGDT